MRKFLIVVALLLAPSILAAEVAAFPPLAGPVRAHDQFLLNTGFVDIEPPPMRSLDQGRWQLDLAVSSANTFTRSESVHTALETREERAPVSPLFFGKVKKESILQEPLFLLDGEVTTTKLRLRRGLSNGIELEASLPLHQLGGGSFDPLVEGFHGLLGLDQDGRDGVARSHYTVFLQGESEEILVDEPPGTEVGDAVLAARRSFDVGGRGLRVMVDGGIKIPTGDSRLLISSGSVDLFSQALLSRCRRRDCVHGGLGFRFLGPWKELGIASQLVASALLGYDLRISETMALVSQLTFAETPHEDLGLNLLAEDSYQLTLGWKKHLPTGQALTLAVIENFFHYENSADIGFHIAFSQGF